MDVWLLVVYVAASVLALRSLISLMTDHKRRYKQKLVIEELAKREAKQKVDADKESDDAGEPADVAA